MTGAAADVGDPQQLPASIPPEYREGVAVQLTTLLRQAQLVLEFPLPDDTEPAPVFRP